MIIQSKTKPANKSHRLYWSRPHPVPRRFLCI